MASLSEYYDTRQVREAVLDAETGHLAKELGAATNEERSQPTINQLRVAAIMSIGDQLGEPRIDALLNELAKEQRELPAPAALSSSFREWNAYMTALADADKLPGVHELLFFAAAGLLASQPTEVRAFLRADFSRSAVKELGQRAEEMTWAARVQADISVALLFLVRQTDHNDVQAARRVIDRLTELQRELEATWLSRQGSQGREAMALLGLYHLAQAVVRLAEFLLAGSVSSPKGEPSTDFGLELRRLVVRAEESISIAGDQDVQFWLNAVVVVLWRLRTDSIWVSGKGISKRLDRLVEELAKVGRERPVFSLLPSQQDALRKSLLDPARIAVVLQMPTSAGKTLLAEFAIVQAFEAYGEDTRVVYVVPTRALATQVRRALAEDLRPLGIQVAAAGSAFEEDPYELNLLLAADGVVVATPEKLDLLLRAHPDWFARLRLVVVDEAHLLDDSERGVRLELLLANIRRERPQARLLLLTPFIGNAAQIASWLGGIRGLSIEVHWRPSRLLVGLAKLSGGRGRIQFQFEWREPHWGTPDAGVVNLDLALNKGDVNTNSKAIVTLADRFMNLGTVLALYSAAPKEAESAARNVALRGEVIPPSGTTPALRVAIAVARSEYGDDSVLATCLERGTAFHHSSLSPFLRYLIEDQIRCGTIKFVAATTTLAQGMNFPVAAVLIHSVHKPYGRGDLTPAEFWNIAGRAGRVGMVDKGLVVFVSKEHKSKFDFYTSVLTQDVRSALLNHLREISASESLKDAYWLHSELRPFVQYLAHAATTMTPSRALANLEELLQGSLANAQAATADDSRYLRFVARKYLGEIAEKSPGYLKAADSTGLGSFSFDELYAKIRADPVLNAGPGPLLEKGKQGLEHLVEALKWLPELSLAIGLGQGEMSAEKVAAVVQGWVQGRSIPDLAGEFPGEEKADQIRNAARYVHSEVSQTIAWGAHAYMRGWALQGNATTEIPANDAMLGAYIQFGVRTPEAAVASLLGIPRQFAEGFADEYREREGVLTPERAPHFKEFVEGSTEEIWLKVAVRSKLSDKVDSRDMRTVVRQMQGLI